MSCVETTGHGREIHLTELIPPAGGSTILSANDFSMEAGVTEHKAQSASRTGSQGQPITLSQARENKYP